MISDLFNSISDCLCSFLSGIRLFFYNLLYTQVIFYTALGSWLYGAVRLADMFEAKTAEQQVGSGWKNSRGGSTEGRGHGVEDGTRSPSPSSEPPVHDGVAARVRSRRVSKPS